MSYGLGAAISGPGTSAVALTQDTATLTTYSSREGAQPPQLLVTINPIADTSAPASPSGLTVTATSARRVVVTWTAATDNVAVVRYASPAVGSSSARRLAR